MIKNLENEVWKDIIGWEGLYQISDMGRVKSVGRIVKTKAFGGTFFTVHEKILKQDLSKGYLRVTLCFEGITSRFQVHRIVGKHFVENPNNHNVINHKKGIKTDNRATELEWTTNSGNEKHAHRFLKKIASCSKMVLDMQTGIYYDSISQAAIAKGIKPGTLLSMFNRKRSNKTSIALV